MKMNRSFDAAILGLFICVGLIGLAAITANTALKVKEMDRVVTVKGLAEREVAADIAIWPIRFDEAGNDLATLYNDLERKTNLIVEFLKKNGFAQDEITIAQPSIYDKQAQAYGGAADAKFRFSATAVITIYSKQVDLVRATSNKIVQLGKQGIAIAGPDYEYRTQYRFTKLNEIKPSMIEESTKNARKAAEKFALDSDSKLGKIKNASQGQFSIQNRDDSAPYIKKVRVVSTVRYLLSD